MSTNLPILVFQNQTYLLTQFVCDYNPIVCAHSLSKTRRGLGTYLVNTLESQTKLKTFISDFNPIICVHFSPRYGYLTFKVG